MTLGPPSVTGADTETVVEQPEVDDHLNPREYRSRGLWALLAEDDMNETALCGSDGLFVHNPKQDFTIVDHHAIVKDRIRRLWIRCAVNANTTGNDHVQDLFPTGPKRLCCSRLSESIETIFC